MIRNVVESERKQRKVGKEIGGVFKLYTKKKKRKKETDNEFAVGFGNDNGE